jgi:hypothetical protein
VHDIGEVIAIIAVAGGLAIPISALFLDFRRRKLQFEERRAMIERGMTPPPLEEMDADAANRRSFERDPVLRREKALHSGIICVFTGVGLALGAWALTLVRESFIPLGLLAGPLSVGAAVVGLVGIGQLVYYAVSRPKA